MRLFGLDFIDAAEVGQVADALLARERIPHREGPLPVLVTPNVDQMVKIDRMADAVAVELIHRAQFTTPDGQPIVWASRLLGCRLAARLPGSSLLQEMWPRIVAAGSPVFVVASSNAIAERITAEHPGASVIVAPSLHPDRPETITEFAEHCLAVIDVERVAFVFVCVGFVRSERLIDHLIARWPSGAPMPLFGAIGASFEMLYGFKRRAPRWMQRMGLEWLFRFVQEPRRLFRRYFVDDVAFVPIVWRAWRSRRAG